MLDELAARFVDCSMLMAGGLRDFFEISLNAGSAIQTQLKVVIFTHHNSKCLLLYSEALM